MLISWCKGLVGRCVTIGQDQALCKTKLTPCWPYSFISNRKASLEKHIECLIIGLTIPSAESMILLGSIERTELQAVFDWWLSPERRAFERGQSSPGQGSKVSWESFTFVDEEGGEESADKV